MGSFCGGQQTQTGTSTTSLDPTALQLRNDAFAKAREVAGQGYTQNPNPRVADFTQDQTKAFDMVRQSLGGWKPTIDAASGMAGAAGGMSITNPDQLAAFMNPYMSGVIDPQLRELDRRTSIARRGVTARANMAGQPGSLRHGVVEGELMRQSGQQAQDIIGKGYSDAFGAATSAMQQEAQRKIAGADALLKTAVGGQQMGGVDLSMLLGIGGQQQGQQQKSLDVLNADFARQQGYPQEQLNILLSALRGTPYSSGTTTTQPGGSTGAQNLGALAALLGGGGKLLGSDGLDIGSWDWSWLGG